MRGRRRPGRRRKDATRLIDEEDTRHRITDERAAAWTDDVANRAASSRHRSCRSAIAGADRTQAGIVIRQLSHALCQCSASPLVPDEPLLSRSVRDIVQWWVVQMPYLLREIRSERDSNPRYQLPGIPHFQVSGARCIAGHRRAPRIQSPIGEGIKRQAKAPALGLRWDSFRVRLDCPVGTRNAHSHGR